jgi:hypothetical protein
MNKSKGYMITYQSECSGERIIMKGTREECDSMFDLVANGKVDLDEKHIKLTLIEVEPLKIYQEVV